MSDPSNADWVPEYDALLEKIAANDDIIGTDWDNLRGVIKHKIRQNIAIFLTSPQKPPPPLTYLATQTENGGLRLPPFPSRTQMHIPMPPVCYMDEQQANAMRQNIFQQLDQFDGGPPFTIQRLCELCVAPRKHYTSIGKYLRAVEKSVLVTSTMESFPPLTEAELFSAGRSAITLGSTLQSAPSTPLFSPISFLHDDPRRSKSRSPPPTPLMLNPIGLDGPIEMKPLGLVDELDDPRPGHLSDQPTALSSVTTLSSVTDRQIKPFLGSLDQRFVKAEVDVSMEATSSIPQELGEAMELDDNKDNTQT